jgi:hypothetical protein
MCCPWIVKKMTERVFSRWAEGFSFMWNDTQIVLFLFVVDIESGRSVSKNHQMLECGKDVTEKVAKLERVVMYSY